MEYHELIVYLNKFTEFKKEELKEKVCLMYLKNRITNTENPPKLEELLADIDGGFKKELEEKDKSPEALIQEKKQAAQNMFNMAKKLNAQFGGHMPK